VASAPVTGSGITRRYRGCAPEGHPWPIRGHNNPEQDHARDHGRHEHGNLPRAEGECGERRTGAQADEAPPDAEQGGPDDQPRGEVAAGRDLEPPGQEGNPAPTGDGSVALTWNGYDEPSRNGRLRRQDRRAVDQTDFACRAGLRQDTVATTNHPRDLDASLSVVIEDGGWSLTVLRALRKKRYAARLFRRSDSMKSMS